MKCLPSKNSVLLKLNLSRETGWIWKIILIKASDNVKIKGFQERQFVNLSPFGRPGCFFPALATLPTATVGPSEQAAMFVPRRPPQARLGKHLPASTLLVVSSLLCCGQTPCHKVRGNKSCHFKMLLPWAVVKAPKTCAVWGQSKKKDPFVKRQHQAVVRGEAWSGWAMMAPLTDGLLGWRGNLQLFRKVLKGICNCEGGEEE